MNLVIDRAFKNWGKVQFDRLPSIRGKLLQDNGVPHMQHLWHIDTIARVFLFPGFEEHFSAMVPRENIVLSHNDT